LVRSSGCGVTQIVSFHFNFLFPPSLLILNFFFNMSLYLFPARLSISTSLLCILSPIRPKPPPQVSAVIPRLLLISFPASFYRGLNLYPTPPQPPPGPILPSPVVSASASLFWAKKPVEECFLPVLLQSFFTLRLLLLPFRRSRFLHRRRRSRSRPRGRREAPFFTPSS